MVRIVAQMDQMISKAQDSQQIFFQNISHELRTPLMSIQGYAEGIQVGVIPLKEGLDIILQQSKKMSSLVESILFLSRLEYQPFTTERVSLADLLYDTANHIYIAGDRLVTFQWALDSPLYCDCQEDAMQKAFDNLISNAGRYAAHWIRISSRTEATSLMIQIANDGAPIAAEDLPHIFERFYKGEKGHTGIGLSLVEEIIEKHGGTISVSSDQQETCFTINLPVCHKAATF